MDWERFVEVIAGAFTAGGTCVAPVLLYIAKNKKRAKEDAEHRQAELRADAERRQAEIKAETDRYHQENKRLLTELVTIQRFFPAHKHGEAEGALTVQGISYPPQENFDQRLKSYIGEFFDKRFGTKDAD